LNALSGTAAWSVPIVCVGGKDVAALEAAATKNSLAEIILQGKDEPNAEAKNVVGKFGNGKKLIVVSTPQSGWFRCAGERGAGVAVFLGLARWTTRQKSLDANWVFVSTTGHEFSGMGMKAFLKELAPKPKDVFAWLHLGANVAVWNYEQTAQGLKKSGKVESRRGVSRRAGLIRALNESVCRDGNSGSHRPRGRRGDASFERRLPRFRRGRGKRVSSCSDRFARSNRAGIACARRRCADQIVR
jgi:hypothetical protein